MTAADVLLADGALAVVRTLEPDDEEALHELHERVSDEALRMRFFTVAPRAAHAYVEHVLSTPETLALAAEVRGRVVALATAEPLDHRSSEVAFLVDDDFRGQGLGTLLLEHLAAMARDRGIRRFEAEVLAENRRMLQVFADAGFRVERRLDAGVQVLEMDTGVTAAVQDAADRREFWAEARSLAPMLAPRSVAVYGVRRDGTGIGATVLRAIRDAGFAGELVAIHPTAEQVDGVRALATVAAHLGGVDLAVIAVPAERAIAALEDAGNARVPAAVVISSGFGEMGEPGAGLQRRLAGLARTHGMRVIGPNCLGLVCNDSEVRLNATFNGSVPPVGGLAVASQSGGVGIVLMDLAGRTELGVRHFVSLGNKADVSSNDLLAAWYDDPEVTCAALYLESFGNARKFARFARRFSERKPLLAVVGGRSSGGRRAGASHTAAAASPEVAVRALFAQAGVIGCTDAEELVDTARILTAQPLPAGRRVAIVSNAGGLGVLAADAADDGRLDVVEFSAELQSELEGLVNQTTGTANPIDAGAGATSGQIAAITHTVLASDEADAAVVLLVATGDNDIGAMTRELAEVRTRHPQAPVVVVPLGGPDIDVPGVTAYRSTAAAMGSLGRAAAYAEWRRTPVTVTETSEPDAVLGARAMAQRLLAGPTSGGWVAPAAARDLLGRYRIDLVGRIVRGADDAATAAAELGFPVALKVADADVVHKTEDRLVRIGLKDPDQVRRAVAEFAACRVGRTEVLVQPMASGMEIAIGVVRDPSLGPLVMVAAGGVAVDVWRDHAFLLPPIGHADAIRALRSLRLWPLLEGFRGAPPADTEALARLVCDAGRLAADVPELAELDLNPVMVGPDHCTIVDAKVRLARPDDSQLDLPRQLRRVR
jgi:acyl-CoA synthetase (NDP forming)/GNAT superfamily N-acetyltransferase